MTSQAAPAIPALPLSPEEQQRRREAAKLLGSIRTPAKLAAIAKARQARAENQKGGRPQRPLSEYACTCGAEESLEGHKTTCPRGLVIYRRRKAGTL